MDLTNTKIIRLLDSVSKTIEGRLSISSQQINGGSPCGRLYHVRIEKEYHDLNTQIYTTLNEYTLNKDEYTKCNMKILATKQIKEKVEISIWRKDIFDKIFSLNRNTTGWKDIDSVLQINTSKVIECKLFKMFANESLRKDFISDKYRAYNVSTDKNILKIQRKSALQFETTEKIVAEYNRFTRFLDGLLIADII